jgi:6-phosphogluconolactonase (cycloisomerase 2 family)
VHADLDEVSAYAIDKQSHQLTSLNRQPVTFRVNQTTGKLAPTGQIVKVGSPVTIAFAAA